MKSNRNYVTENINLKQQVIALKVANKDKAETIKAMKQELLEYNQLRKRFKVLYEENEKLKKAIEILKNPISLEKIKCENGYIHIVNIGDIQVLITQQEYELLKEVLGDA